MHDLGMHSFKATWLKAGIKHNKPFLVGFVLPIPHRKY